MVKDQYIMLSRNCNFEIRPESSFPINENKNEAKLNIVIQKDSKFTHRFVSSISGDEFDFDIVHFYINGQKFSTINGNKPDEFILPKVKDIRKRLIQIVIVDETYNKKRVSTQL